MCVSVRTAVNAATGLPTGTFTGRGGKSPINYNIEPQIPSCSSSNSYLLTL